MTHLTPPSTLTGEAHLTNTPPPGMPLRLSTAGRARPSGGKRRSRLSTPCCDQFRLALRRSVETAQYASEPYQAILARHGFRCSMSRRGNCLDNAPMESFFGSLKTELVHRTAFPTREAARRAIFGYVEGFYNRRRRHSALGFLTPARAYEQMARAA